jgi:hypothetical protein
LCKKIDAKIFQFLIITAFLLKFVLFCFVLTELIMDTQNLQETVNEVCNCILIRTICEFNSLCKSVNAKPEIFLNMTNTLCNKDIKGESILQIIEHKEHREFRSHLGTHFGKYVNLVSSVNAKCSVFFSLHPDGNGNFVVNDVLFDKFYQGLQNLQKSQKSQKKHHGDIVDIWGTLNTPNTFPKGTSLIAGLSIHQILLSINGKNINQMMFGSPDGDNKEQINSYSEDFLCAKTDKFCSFLFEHRSIELFFEHEKELSEYFSVNASEVHMWVTVTFTELGKIVMSRLSSRGQSALYIACRFCHPVIVGYLLKCPKINVNIQNTDGSTPALGCAWGYNIDEVTDENTKAILGMLKERHADFTIKNHRDENALKFCSKIIETLK